MGPGFVHDPFFEGGIGDIPPRPDFFRISTCCEAAHHSSDERNRLHHGLEIFLTLIRVVAFFEIFKVDLRGVARIVRAKRHFAATIARVGLQDKPGKVVLDANALRIALFIASEIGRQAEDKEIGRLVGSFHNGGALQDRDDDPVTGVQKTLAVS